VGFASSLDDPALATGPIQLIYLHVNERGLARRVAPTAPPAPT
jgi:hypothetical protein